MPTLARHACALRPAVDDHGVIQAYAAPSAVSLRTETRVFGSGLLVMDATPSAARLRIETQGTNLARDMLHGAPSRHACALRHVLHSHNTFSSHAVPSAIRPRTKTSGLD